MSYGEYSYFVPVDQLQPEFAVAQVMSLASGSATLELRFQMM
jgi:hypothetical protein